jgi:hypothetical protein
MRAFGNLDHTHADWSLFFTKGSSVSQRGAGIKKAHRGVSSISEDALQEQKSRKSEGGRRLRGG